MINITAHVLKDSSENIAKKKVFKLLFLMLLVSLASDFLVSIENHNSEGKERKINKGRRRTEKAIGHYLKNSCEGTQQRCH